MAAQLSSDESIFGLLSEYIVVSRSEPVPAEVALNT